ncbi:hypothetical protein MKX01_013901 [Papaver californicum]|nr:hypothetical protein MKX01_013901 [Papaver californicum]
MRQASLRFFDIYVQCCPVYVRSFGEVTNARVIMDRDTRRSRGFGFVGYTSEENASQALSSMDGRDLGGRSIRVSYANERSPRNGGYGNSV